jgi:hypothetical protein
MSINSGAASWAALVGCRADRRYGHCQSIFRTSFLVHGPYLGPVWHCAGRLGCPAEPIAFEFRPSAGENAYRTLPARKDAPLSADADAEASERASVLEGIGQAGRVEPDLASILPDCSIRRLKP